MFCAVCTAGYLATINSAGTALATCTVCPIAAQWAPTAASGNIATSCANPPLGVTVSLVSGVPTAARTAGYADAVLPSSTGSGTAATSKVHLFCLLFRSRIYCGICCH